MSEREAWRRIWWRVKLLWRAWRNRRVAFCRAGCGSPLVAGESGYCDACAESQPREVEGRAMLNAMYQQSFATQMLAQQAMQQDMARYHAQMRGMQQSATSDTLSALLQNIGRGPLS